MAVTGPRIDMPRLPHSPIWSHQPRTRGGGSSRVEAASACGAGCVGFSRSAVMHVSLRRHYPVRFVRSAAPRISAALSARLVRAPAGAPPALRPRSLVSQLWVVRSIGELPEGKSPSALFEEAGQASVGQW